MRDGSFYVELPATYIIIADKLLIGWCPEAIWHGVFPLKVGLL